MHRVRTGSGKLWKFAIFQDLESYGKREVFQTGYENVLDFCLEKF